LPLQVAAAQAVLQELPEQLVQLQMVWELAEAEAEEKLLAAQAAPEEQEELQAAEAVEVAEHFNCHRALLQAQAVQVVVQKLEYGYSDEQLFCNQTI
jgi:multidrug resistance efflux pump